MKKIKKIIVACDFSDYAPLVIDYAAGVADEMKAGLIIVNVINQRDVEAIKSVEKAYPPFSADDYLQEHENERLKKLDVLIAEASCEHLTVKKIIKMGVPFKKLLEVLKNEGADLLVMGSKGRSNLAGVIFGSTAEKMFRRCPVPLLSIREKIKK